MEDFKIGNRIIGNAHKCFLIAEAGVNHNGDLETARKLIDIAVDAGADAVKFQTFITKNLLLNDIEKAPYQKVTSKKDESQTEMIKHLELDRDFHLQLVDYCSKKQIIFLSTPYCLESLDLLVELDVPAIKIASTDATNLIFLEQVAKCKKPILLSTGMCSLAEIEQAYQCLKQNGCQDISIFKCTSNYPTEAVEVNLRAILTLRNAFDVVIGFSDHTEGVGASPYAVTMGAKIIEKHFTISKDMKGPDHKASLNPDELRKWVKEIRKVEVMLGSKSVYPTASEQLNKNYLQKNLVAKSRIEKGELLTKDKLAAKRTGGIGIRANAYKEIIGSRATRTIDENHPIMWSYFQD
ncbi:MAG: N-acetylneuraminate synthase [Candidatus Stygibacter australis]|nr:N-acetylneuraminate synthase [Candidatus Stygibacter australis]MDP8321126.1 N-acetylneuraminate synthase [Candidatus Stygibacter australis]